MSEKQLDDLIAEAKKMGGVALRHQTLSLHQNGAKFRIKRAYLEDEVLNPKTIYTMILIPEKSEGSTGSGFFDNITFETRDVDVGGTIISAKFPILYYERKVMSASFSIPVDQVYPLLPSPDLIPVLDSRGLASVQFTAAENVNMGEQTMPYNDVFVFIPVQFGTLEGDFAFLCPTSNRLSVLAGQAAHGLPRFFANINFMEKEGTRTCEVIVDEVLFFRITGKILPPGVPIQFERKILAVKDGTVLKTLSENQGQVSISKSLGDAKVHFGDQLIANYPLANKLRSLKINPKSIVYSYGIFNSKVYYGVPIGKV